MESLHLLVPLAFIILIVALAIFFWAVKSGQFDDLDTEAKRILFDDKKSQNSREARGENADDRQAPSAAESDEDNPQT